jgi:hypothetical protein
MRDHKKLRAFELADQLAMLTYKQTGKLPKDELFGLVSQMRRAAVSIASILTPVLTGDLRRGRAASTPGWTDGPK